MLQINKKICTSGTFICIGMSKIWVGILDLDGMFFPTLRSMVGLADTENG